MSITRIEHTNEVNIITEREEISFEVNLYTKYFNANSVGEFLQIALAEEQEENFDSAEFYYRLGKNENKQLSYCGIARNQVRLGLYNKALECYKNAITCDYTVELCLIEDLWEITKTLNEGHKVLVKTINNSVDVRLLTFKILDYYMLDRSNFLSWIVLGMYILEYKPTETNLSLVNDCLSRAIDLGYEDNVNISRMIELIESWHSK
ncbi:MAG: hypothetical protein OEZ01_15015 [Candidatus Heimdallarchaeota archaeon]|nr:hypothetical protein [Candidatus Heimdallarchaeota archaeon]MDH5647318.1 hypothetical protein [Candidatus Heimdallarchaeota archaeon]